jgi:hypothetical protein
MARTAGAAPLEVPLPYSPETLVSQWIESFNERNLDGLLECMSGEVRFYPLRLAGLDPYYLGHDGVREWFARMAELGYRHQIAVHSLRAEPGGEVVAVGELRLDDGSDVSRFWARDQVADGKIVVAHRYLTDPDIFDSISVPKRRTRPPRLPGT